MTRGQVRQRSRIENASAREQRRLLSVTRREILAELPSTTGFRRFQLSQMLQAIDRHIADGKRAAETAAANAADRAWRLGVDVVDAAIPTPADPAFGIWGVSDELLGGLKDVIQDQERAVWSELGTRLKTAVRRTTLGVDDPFEAMTRLARVIRDPKTFGDAMTRAETIIRTEVNRVAAISQQRRSVAQAQSMEKVGLRLYKYWLKADMPNVRPAHEAAAKRYSKDAPIPVDEPFVVDGEKLMNPLDPNGSPGNTINCRCVSVLVVKEVEP
jgi:hypothetical protein